jgi:hypothetical protein
VNVSNMLSIIAHIFHSMLVVALLPYLARKSQISFHSE